MSCICLFLLQGTNMLSRLLHVRHPTAKQAVITAIDLLGLYNYVKYGLLISSAAVLHFFFFLGRILSLGVQSLSEIVH